ncbi:MAG TPA: hypothetical protein DDX39_03995 [Bacteroidales bacterium]|nr:MAG: hypothetical protein A2W98_09155 [Bacteroidetes bacterium GWF2_33_38]HBF87783.1 hypothetical protein [Bacteroidales bacterium]
MKILRIIIIVPFFFIILLTVNGQDRKKIDSLWCEFQKAKHDTTCIQLFIDIGVEYDAKMPDSALFYYIKAMNLTDKVISSFPDNKNKQKSKDEKKLDFGKIRLSAFKAISLRNVGSAYTNLGNYNLANDFFIKSLKIYQEIKDEYGISKCYLNIGTIHYRQGTYDKAISYFIRSLQIYEKLGFKKGIADGSTTVGLIHYQQHNYDKALKYFENSLKIYEELNENRGISICYMNIGNVYKDQGYHEKAIEYYSNSIKIAEKIGDKQGISRCYTNMGIVFYNQKNYEKVITYFLKSLKIKEELGDKYGIAVVWGNIAGLHVTIADSVSYTKNDKNAHYNEAINYGLKAFYVAKEINSISLQNEIAVFLKNAYKSLGNSSKSLEYAEIFIATQDSLFSERKNKALAEVEVKYEAEKKQLLIDNLNKENALKKAELIQSEEKRSKQLILIYSFVVGFIIILVFSSIIFRLFMQKKKANTVLALQKNQIEIQNSKLNQANEEITAQRDLVTEQKEHIEKIHKDVTDSINYAKRIQEAILPITKETRSILGEHFILFKPKDIVSGDFYWLYKRDSILYVAVADCTGHGVPGAFMSMLGISFLNKIVQENKKIQANQILDKSRSEIILALKQGGLGGEQKDGMDIAICIIDTKNNIIQFSGANNPIYIIKSKGGNILKEFSVKSTSCCYKENTNELIDNSKSSILNPVNSIFYEINADKEPVGISPQMKPFTNHEFQLHSGDCLYLRTDGFQDQFGGPKGKKFLSKNLKQLLITNCRLPMPEQKIMFETTLTNWIGDGEQIDDITLLGIKI